MIHSVDQIGQTIELPAIPRRIISLVPSQTELLHYLGLDESVVGITKFCIHPNTWFRQKQRVGGTKNVNIESVRALQPDLVIANKEENVREQIEILREIAPVWVSDVNNLADAFSMITAIGELTGTSADANQLVSSLQSDFSKMPAWPRRRTAYLIWKDPYMSVGGDTFIHHMMEAAAFENVFAHEVRYPQIDLDRIRESSCELLLLSSEPYPFNDSHLEELKKALPGVQVKLVDGEMFSWYGSHLLHTAEYFRTLHDHL